MGSMYVRADEQFTFATAYTSDGEEYDRLGNFETAIQYANDGYRVVIHESTSLHSREDMQRAVDAELAAALDCFGEDWLQRGEDDTMPDDDDCAPHWHVVAFINGCLNDYTSPPYDTVDDARAALAEYVNNGGILPDRPCQRIDSDTFLSGHYCITIEDCFDDCSDSDSW